ncbi:MAG: alanine--tRNA ligase [Proteobacteria bacterium]|nr:alanine--tRNA ligase [Pseudomonadota bacterium]
MKTADLRQAFLEFYESKGHRIVPSSSLVPNNDPTLLFTNAGMNQFKDPLLGKSDPGYTRATTAQRCVRAGGKHNDLENVGYTARHHTFFEMMGNFSFGDYFKEETITWAWEFATDVVGLDASKILITVHPTDDDSRKIWRDKVGIANERIIDLEENFWTMGDTGPCGPCTELFYDHGPSVAGGPPGSPDEDGDRFIEFQNLVFPQFDRSADGNLDALPQPGVDTGMGLERMAAILQGVHSNYEIDLFARVMQEAGKFAGITDTQEILQTASLRVIADHIRSSAFLIVDGVLPGNEDRAYVLRRIIRRGLRHGYKLDIQGSFFHKLVPVLVEEMGDAYPLLAERADAVVSALADEEARFSETLNQGMELLKKELGGVTGQTLPGDVAFKLYDTYGFPVDLTADVARELNMEVDQAGVDEAMEAQRARGRAATSFSTTLGQKISMQDRVQFCGYEQLSNDASVVAIFDEQGDPLEALDVSDTGGVVVLDKTAFYAESGGQVGDSGLLHSERASFVVVDTQISGDQYLHIGRLQQGCIRAGDTLQAAVDDPSRTQTRANHSATHLLHAALRQVLGEHVQQKGSLVNAEKLRFDFAHTGVIESAQLAAIEELVNAQIRQNTSVETQLLSYDDAVANGAMALFGEKYGDEVRVLTMGDGFSVELCGGTHVSRTGDIGLFRIVSEAGIAAGVRRIEAVTGQGALQTVQADQDLLADISQTLKVGRLELAPRLQQVVAENRALLRQVEQLGQQLAANKGSDLGSHIEEIHGVQFLAAQVEGDNKAMMQTLDTVRGQMQQQCVIVLAAVDAGKVCLVAAVSKDLANRASAAELMQTIAPSVGAKGGGRPDLARAGGGDNAAGVADALSAARAWAEQQLAG